MSEPVDRKVIPYLKHAWSQTRTAKSLKDRMANGSPLRSAKNDVVNSKVWKAVFPKPFPETRRDQSEIAITSSWLHIHPATISKRALNFTCTYGLGGLCMGLFLILLATGILLMFFYVPAVDHAYKDMVDLQTVVSLGKIMRNMHRWAAHLMVIVVCLHMARVFLQKAYTGPRKLNWVVGTVLLVITMLLSFTGYLLPWDQLALWAITVGTNMAGAIPVLGEKIRYMLLGGYTVEQPTLIRFYVLHVFVLPATLTVLMAYHFWRVRKDGFSGGLKNERED